MFDLLILCDLSRLKVLSWNLVCDSNNCVKCLNVLFQFQYNKVLCIRFDSNRLKIQIKYFLIPVESIWFWPFGIQMKLDAYERNSRKCYRVWMNMVIWLHCKIDRNLSAIQQKRFEILLTLTEAQSVIIVFQANKNYLNNISYTFLDLFPSRILVKKNK